MKSNLSPTESIDNSLQTIDKLSPYDALVKMLSSHEYAVKAVQKNLAEIERAVYKMHSILQKSKTGRIIYAGAGTSARIGIQDGVELYPTFGWDPKRLEFIIAGGKMALTKPVENAEDSVEQAIKQFDDLNVNKNDIIISIAASGNTPFTCTVVESASKKEVTTVSLSNNPDGKILLSSEFKIILDTGPEVIAGSTRLKAGTAQKICLNLISTSLMISLNRVKNGQMSHLVATNFKLRERKKRIDQQIT